VRDLRQATTVRDAVESLAPPFEATLEPQRPEGSRRRERVTTPHSRLHLLPEGGQGAKTLITVQGVVATYDPLTGEGLVVSDADRSQYVLAPEALAGSLFRLLRQGQRVNFDLDPDGRATRVRIGSEPDMGLPPDIQL
jgi:cold shock CspA family protein